MPSRYDTIVIGAGQAGLASAFYLQQAGASFVVVDGANEVGASWLKRWDSLRLFTPARYNSLPGLRFPGAPYSLPTKSEVARYFKVYTERFGLPVRLNTQVRSLTTDDSGYVVATDSGELRARSVVVATGAYHRPFVPGFARDLAPGIRQVHSSEYRNPSMIASGPVLVVGAGNSGAQIAVEVARSGRPTWLSGRDTGSIPRRLLGRDVYDWLWWTVMRPSVESRLGRRLMQGRMFTGDPLVGFTRKDLTHPMLTPVGRTERAEGGQPILDNGQALRDVRTVIWCTGFRPDFSWIQLPVFRDDGYPDHRRGMVDSAPGLAFVGLRYQHRMSSALLGGVRADARYVVRQLRTNS